MKYFVSNSTRIISKNIAFFKFILAHITNSEALKASTKRFDVLMNISSIVSNNNDLLTEFREKLAAFTDGIKNSASDIEKHAFNVLKSAVENCNTDSMDTDSDNFETIKKFKNISDAYIKLAHFIRGKGDESLQGDFILFVLRAMRLNSSEARQLFPCILMQNDLSGIYKDTFITEVRSQFTIKIPRSREFLRKNFLINQK